MNFSPSRFFVPLALTFLPLTDLSAQAPDPPAGTQPAKPRRIPVNGIVAKVNGEVITRNQLKIEVAPQEAVLRSQFPDLGPAYKAQLAQYMELVLNELIDRAIIFSEFKDRISVITDQQIEDEISRIVARQYNGDEELFKEYLRKARVTRDQFKQQQRREILVQIVRTQHFGEVAVPRESELREVYEKFKITNRDRSKDVVTYRRIYFFKTGGAADTEKLEKAKRIMQRLKDGEDFATLAKAHSEDSRAEDGGLWADEKREMLNPQFATLLFEMPGDKLLGPLDDGNGYNILKIEKKTLGPPPSFEESRQQLKLMVTANKKKANFERWMKKMRSRADIKKMDF